MNAGTTEFIILISSQGGSTFHGNAIYNYLKGISPKVVTHNYGSIISMASIIFCAGEERYTVPHGIFQIHPARSGAVNQLTVEDLRELLGSVDRDNENMAGIIASATNKSEKEILEKLRQRTNLNSEQAKEFGLVHKIKEKLFELGSEVIVIKDQQAQPQIIQIPK